MNRMKKVLTLLLTLALLLSFAACGGVGGSTAESLNFHNTQTVEGVVKAIGLDKCKLCTYCWNGKE